MHQKVPLAPQTVLERVQEDRVVIQDKKDYYARLTYVCGDRSERMLLDAARNGVFRNHPGRVLFRVVDAMDPAACLAKDEIAALNRDQPFQAVFLNYILDCLPAAHLKREADSFKQLCVRTCLPRNIDLAEFTSLTAQDLGLLARSADPLAARRLQDLFGLFASEYDYRPLEKPLPFLDFALAYSAGATTATPHPSPPPQGGRGPSSDASAQRREDEPTREGEAPAEPGHVGGATGSAGASPSQTAPFQAGPSPFLFNYGAIQSLDALLELVAADGFLLINDYGHMAEPKGDFEHQRFSDATAVGLNFALLGAYFASRQLAWEARQELSGFSRNRDSLISSLTLPLPVVLSSVGFPPCASCCAPYPPAPSFRGVSQHARDSRPTRQSHL